MQPLGAQIASCQPKQPNRRAAACKPKLAYPNARGNATDAAVLRASQCWGRWPRSCAPLKGQRRHCARLNICPCLAHASKVWSALYCAIPAKGSLQVAQVGLERLPYNALCGSKGGFAKPRKAEVNSLLGL